MQVLNNLFQILSDLPWWGGFALLGSLVAIGYGLSWHVRRRFDKIVNEVVLSVGSALKGAEVKLHSVSAAPRPTEPSPYDLDKDDDQYMEDLDGTPWDEEGVNFYLIDATIAPVNPGDAWDPTFLALVPADFNPADPTDACEHLGGLHSAELFINGRFQPAYEGDVSGPQRLRMLFGVGEDLRAVKFAAGVNYFGHVDLPIPLASSPKVASRH